MAYPSHVARGALRHALRTHPDADTVLNGRRVNDLTLGNLYDALRHLSVDPEAIARDALNAPPGNLPINVLAEPQDQDTAPMPGHRRHTRHPRRD